MKISPILPLMIAAACLTTARAQPISQPIVDQLQTADLTLLVRDAMQQGDAQRGAILFHQQHMQCAKCHATSDKQSLLGPSLVQFDKQIQRPHLVESILYPSKVIREGYQTVVAVTDQGKPLSGILEADREGQLVIRDASRDGRQLVLDKGSLEQWSLSKQSLMPEGLINQLGSKQQFLDLVRYVIEVAEHGPRRAKELAPPAALVQLPPLPEYENDIDHAGMLADLDDEAYQRGQKIYNRVCANCHGTHQRQGSLPTAPRFADGKLKNGSDPHRMYQTLTHGFGMMVAQRWMVPKQKYDVIHYIREAYFKQSNPALYASVSPQYLEQLPKGQSRGPDGVLLEPWVTMDYGPSLNHTYEITLNNTGEDIGWDLGRGPKVADPWANPDEYFGPGEAPNFAYKGIAVRVDLGPGGMTRGSHWIVYDHDTMNVQAAWSGNSFIDFSCIQFDGKHACHNRLTGKIHFENPVGPGWAHPLTGVFADPRPLGRDGRAYGPIPRGWCQYRGLYHHGARAILSYTVGGAVVLEMPGLVIDAAGPSIFTRQLSIGPAAHRLAMRVAPLGTHVQVHGSEDVALEDDGGYVVVRVPARSTRIHLQVLVSDQPISGDVTLPDPVDLQELTQGGPPRWPERVRTEIKTVHNDVFAVDDLTLPSANPWNCQVRATGHDFFADGKRAAVCTWDGDVWIVQGIDQDQGELVWQRIASGMFQPLGLKIVDEQIYVTCRDQLVILRDLNDDGETDFYECFNNDHQVTEHFHEFAMGLQVDDDGNFYYAKSARHAKRAVVPHHGTLLRISPDGRKTDIIATGFRAANGVCLNPDGSFFVTDQEGHWNPKNRINWVTEGGFYGNMYGFTDQTDPSDDAMLPPLCWITNAFDRSPAELLWVPESTWGPLGGSLLNLSYGYGKIFVVPHERIGDQLQGGMCQLPIPPFPSGLVRGRFHGTRGDLYLCAMFSWAGSQHAPGGFYRVRYDGKPAHLPVGLAASEKRLSITFSDPVQRASAMNPKNYVVKAWDIRRTPNYGSKHYNEHQLAVASAQLAADGRTIHLVVPKLAPTWCMSIQYELKGAGGREFEGEIHNSIHRLPASSSLSARR